MDILVKGDRIDALSIICDRRDAEVRGRAVIKKLKQEIPRHMFEVPLQAAIDLPNLLARGPFSVNSTPKCQPVPQAICQPRPGEDRKSGVEG